MVLYTAILLNLPVLKINHLQYICTYVNKKPSILYVVRLKYCVGEDFWKCI